MRVHPVTELAPAGVTIWTNNLATAWQAVRDDGKAWGPRRRRQEEALADARVIAEEPTP